MRARNAAGADSLRSPRRRPVDSARQSEILKQVAAILFQEGFTQVSVDELCERLHCSKATLYSIAGSKEQLVMRITKQFFASSASEIEASVAEKGPARARILQYLSGVGAAMGSMSSQFYHDMVSYPPTAQIYLANTQTAARRVRELIDEGVHKGEFRQVDGAFAAQLVALAIEGIHSGELLQDSGLSAGAAFSELGDLLLNGLQST